MADGTIGLPVDDVGKKLDTEELTVAATTVQRERTQLAGALAAEIAKLANTDPGAADYGLVTREAGPIVPKVDDVTSVALGIGASIDLDASTISASTIGKLQQVVVSSSVACKWVVKTRDGAVLVNKHTFHTSGVSGSKPSDTWTPPTKEHVTLAGAGVDENFRVTVTNLGQVALEAADVFATFVWDEV